MPGLGMREQGRLRGAAYFMPTMISVLYTRQNSIYKKLGLDCWDIKRDARNWPGGNAIIAHPPCRAWGNYRHKAKARPDEKQLAIHAINQVRRWGGVLEHPKGSQLWKELNLPLPGTYDEYGGWTLNIDQHWFGHRAKKSTNLYIVGISPREIPAYPLILSKPKRTIELMGRAEREATPLKLALWLKEMTEKIQMNVINGRLVYNGLILTQVKYLQKKEQIASI